MTAEETVILVSQVRTLAIGIRTASEMGAAKINHERLGTLEQRLAWIAAAADNIAETARVLYPNQPLVNLPEGLTWKTSI